MKNNLGIRTRVIPTLLIERGNLVKTTRFGKPDYLGDPINALKIFNEKGVDEVCVLDIRKTADNERPDYDLLGEMASQAFMPLSYGGGIKSIKQIREILRIGFEKVIINSAFIYDESLITKASRIFGNQSIIVSIDYKKSVTGIRAYACDGKRITKYSPIQLAIKAEKLGAGEILLYSMDRDGTGRGYDLNVISKVSGIVNIPIIACGGAANLSDMKQAFMNGADAVAAGSVFVYFGKRKAVLINYPGLQEFVDSGVYGSEVLKYEI